MGGREGNGLGSNAVPGLKHLSSEVPGVPEMMLSGKPTKTTIALYLLVRVGYGLIEATAFPRRTCLGQPFCDGQTLACVTM